MITQLPFEILHCIVEFLLPRKNDYMYDYYLAMGNNINNLLRASREIKHMLNKVGNKFAFNIHYIEPCLVPENYCILDIKNEKLVNKINAKYPNLRLCLRYYSPINSDHKNCIQNLYELSLARETPDYREFYKYPNLNIIHGKYETVQDIRKRSKDKEMRIELRDVSNEEFIGLSINKITLKRCHHITIDCKNIQDIELNDCSNITIKNNIDYLNFCNGTSNINIDTANLLVIYGYNKKFTFNTINMLIIRSSISYITGVYVKTLNVCKRWFIKNISIKQIDTIMRLNDLRHIYKIKGLTKWPRNYIDCYIQHDEQKLFVNNNDIEIFDNLEENDSHGSITVKNCPNLEKLNTGACNSLTVSDCPKLTDICMTGSLTVQKCPNVNDLGFIAPFVQANQLTVSIDQISNLKILRIGMDNVPVEYIFSKTNNPDNVYIKIFTVHEYGRIAYM